MSLLEKAKIAIRKSATDSLDNDVLDLIETAKEDLRAAGIRDDVIDDAESYPLVRRAIITYVRTYYGEPEDFTKMKAAYDEQKAQLKVARSYKKAVR